VTAPPESEAREPAATAELLADRGEAAADPEHFFRCRPFLDAEAVTHTLRIEAGDGQVLLAPLVVREIPAAPEHRDAISPYGYPGLVPPPAKSGRTSARSAGESATAPGDGGAPVLDPSGVDFSATGLVSAFVRHTLGEPPLAGTTERNVVQIADPELPPKSRASDRRQIRRNLEDGYELELTPGPQTTPAQRAAFLDLYEQTMRRTAAADHYFFGAAYFDRVLESPLTWMAIARAPGGDPAAASLAAASDGFLHYYLSGSADEERRRPPGRALRRARPPPQPRRRDRPRRRPGGVQARLRQPLPPLADLRAGLRPVSLPATERRKGSGRVLPRLPKLAASHDPAASPPASRYSAGSSGVGPLNLKAKTGSPPYLPQVALPKARIASSVAAPS
jgi:hypothetical protein